MSNFTEDDVAAIVSPSWAPILTDQFNEQYMMNIMKTLRAERLKYEIAPASEDVFKAFKLCSFEDTRVVILGQD